MYIKQAFQVHHIASL